MGRRDRRAEKAKRRRTIISLVIIFLMVFGFTLAAIVMNSPVQTQQEQQQQTGDGSITYGDYEFEYRNNYYVTEVNGRERQFIFPPSSTLSVFLSDNVTSLLANSAVGITFNPDSPDVQYLELARYDFTINLDSQVYPGITKNSSQYDQPILTCDDASPQSPIILLRTSNTTEVTESGGCVIVSGSQGEIVRASERIIYELIGIV